ncbi:unnamed protein product [Cylindrotheca closterium]|uniref:glucan endo-1,3-beta-D-glucosidase n=1 Tax=Cylindrotheca closterium TaxID=2856 RepID=A0AAD2PX44_9STRA|nr:unnamed protein product [Cylindrotheca closterium]
MHIAGTCSLQPLFTTSWLLVVISLITGFTPGGGAVVVVAQTPPRPQPVKLRGLNYNTRKGPDWAPDDARCKSRAEIVTDLQLLQKMTNRIRLLSITDCNQSEMVLDVAKEIGMQVYLGLWVDEEKKIWLDEISAFEDLLIRGVVDPSVVIGVTVGSEVLLRKDATLAELMDYQSQVSLALATFGAGNLAVSIVEISYYYGLYSDLRDSSDTLYMNIFPYFIWQDTYNINGSVDQLIGDATRVIQKASGTESKPFILGETGWPSAGGRPGLASPEHQVEYFVDFYCKVHLGKPDWDYYYFTGIDNKWRAAQGSLNMEGTFGFFTADNLALKPHFQNLEFECDGTKYSFAATDWTPSFPQESCKSHSMCAGIGGDCCPTSDGIFLGCCENAPTDAPTTSPPTGSPTDRPTKAPTAKPTRLPTVSTDNPTILPTPIPPTQSCLAHEACVSEGLQGNCCPTNTINGIWLGCCDDPPTGLPTTPPPTPPPPTKSPSRAPTPSPTAAPTTRIPTTNPPTTAEPTVSTLRPTASPTKATSAPTESPTKATSAPTVAPITRIPTTNPPTTAEPTVATLRPTFPPTKAPTTESLSLPPQMCLAHQTCRQEGRFGLCCPTPEGIMLGCCDGQNKVPSMSPTTTRTQKPTTSKPTLSPVGETTDLFFESPTIAPTKEPIGEQQGNIFSPPPTKAPTVEQLDPTNPTSRPVASANGVVSNAVRTLSMSPIAGMSLILATTVSVFFSFG